MSGACCGDDDEAGVPVSTLTLRPSPRATGSQTAADGTSAGADEASRPDLPTSAGVPEPVRPRWRRWADHLALPLASGVLLLAGFLLGRADQTTLADVAHGASVLAGAATFVPGALRALARRRLGVGLLMTIAAIGAIALGHLAEAAALAFLFATAEGLEALAMASAKAGLRSLLSLVPDVAVVSRGGADVTIPAQDVRVRDHLVIRAGDRVATDGVVVTGQSAIDTSAVTGESIPVDVEPGSEVPAGAVNGSGVLVLEATADGRDNSLTTLVRLVEQAHAAKGERARLADRIARPLVPAILLLAVLVAVVGSLLGDPGTWISRALVVLVAASPCALAISVPVTVISAIGAASRFGVIIKSGATLEQLGLARAVALDKTGTLTRNAPQVVAVLPAAGEDERALVRLAAALEARSSHPLAGAIVAAAGSDELPTVAEVEERPGEGVRAQVDGVTVRVGNRRWIDAGESAGAADDLEAQGMTVVLVERDSVVLGVLGIRDELRPEARDVVASLDAMGLSLTVLTGDNEATARAVAGSAGIADVRAALRPEDKAVAVRELGQRGVTVMVGDGINDAPALASADIGIAMGARGSDAAVESADVAFTRDDLGLLPRAVAHARRARRIMAANIVLSLLIVAVLVPLSGFGVLGLATVVLVHELAEVVVIFNGIRASRAPRSV